MARSDAIIELSITFYDEPRDILGRTPVAVSMNWPRNRPYSPEGLGDLFSAFYHRVLFIMGSSPWRGELERIISSCFASGISNNTDVIHGERYALELVMPKGRPCKYVKVRISPGGTLRIKFSYRGEEYYLPMGILAFLQYVVNDLDENDIAIFSAHAWKGLPVNQDTSSCGIQFLIESVIDELGSPSFRERFSNLVVSSFEAQGARLSSDGGALDTVIGLLQVEIATLFLFLLALRDSEEAYRLHSAQLDVRVVQLGYGTHEVFRAVSPDRLEEYADALKGDPDQQMALLLATTLTNCYTADLEALHAMDFSGYTKIPPEGSPNMFIGWVYEYVKSLLEVVIAAH